MARKRKSKKGQPPPKPSSPTTQYDVLTNTRPQQPNISPQAKQTKEIQELRAETERILKKRKEVFEKIRSKRRYYDLKETVLLWLMILSSLPAAHMFQEGLREGSLLSSLGFILRPIAFFIWSLDARALRKGPPNEEKERDIWLWKVRRNSFILLSLTFTLFFASLLLSGLERPGNSISNFFLIMGWVSYIIMALVVLLVHWKPQLFLSKFLNQLFMGSILVVAISLLPVFFFRSWNITFLLETLVGGTVVIISLVLIATWIVNLTPNRILNPLQYGVVHFVTPDRLLYALRTHSQLIESEIKALGIIERLESQQDYGTQIALLEYLTKRHQPRTGAVGSLLIVILIFVLGAIGEAFFQDLLYDLLLKPILCHMVTTFCNS